MGVVEVCYRSGHRKVHGAEFPHQALQFLPAHPEMRGWDSKQLEELQVFSLRKGNLARLRVDPPPQHLFFAGPVALACHQFLDAGVIIGLARRGRKKPFQCPDRAVKDLMLSVSPPLHQCYHIVHVTIDVREAFHGVGWARAGLRYCQNGAVCWHWERRLYQCIRCVCKCF